MIDLKKLQNKFDSLFEEETEESFNQWLEGKKNRELLALLGTGEIATMKTKSPTLPKDLVCMPINLSSISNENSILGNTQYAMAA